MSPITVKLQHCMTDHAVIVSFSDGTTVVDYPDYHGSRVESAHVPDNPRHAYNHFVKVLNRWASTGYVIVSFETEERPYGPCEEERNMRWTSG